MSEEYIKASKHLGRKYQPFSGIDDLGRGRLEDMGSGIDIQCISQAPGPASLFTVDICRQSNDQLYRSIKDNSRLVGFATLPMGNPQAAALELERAVLDYSFKGALIGNHHDGKFHDAKAYLPVFEKAQDFDVPIYIHPSPPTNDMMKLLYCSDTYSDEAAFVLGTSAHGWHELTGMHILRLIMSGLFDRLPRLKIIIGHAGEGLPAMIARIEARLQPVLESKRTFKQIMETNIYITTAGFFSIPVLRLLLDVIPIDRLIFSIDYPYSRNSEGLTFLKKVAKSGIMTQSQFDAFTHLNSRRLLKL